MTTEEEDICPACGGWCEEEYFSEQSWDWEKRPCHVCNGTGQAKRPEKIISVKPAVHRSSA